MDEQTQQANEGTRRADGFGLSDELAMSSPSSFVPKPPFDPVGTLRKRAEFHREEAERCEARAGDPDLGDLDKRFTYHPPKGDQPMRYESIRSFARGFAEEILAACPPSRERSLALTNIEQACFWANASIARRS